MSGKTKTLGKSSERIEETFGEQQNDDCTNESTRKDESSTKFRPNITKAIGNVHRPESNCLGTQNYLNDNLMDSRFEDDRLSGSGSGEGEEVPFFQRRASDGMVEFIKQIKGERTAASAQSLFSWDSKQVLSSNEGLWSQRDEWSNPTSFLFSSNDSLFSYNSKNIKRYDAFFEAVNREDKLLSESFNEESKMKSTRLLLLQEIVFSDSTSAFRSHPLFPLLKDLVIIEKFLDLSVSSLGLLVSVSTPIDHVLECYEKVNRELFDSYRSENAITEAIKDAIKYVYDLLSQKSQFLK